MCMTSRRSRRSAAPYGFFHVIGWMDMQLYIAIPDDVKVWGFRSMGIGTEHDFSIEHSVGTPFWESSSLRNTHYLSLVWPRSHDDMISWNIILAERNSILCACCWISRKFVPRPIQGCATLEAKRPFVYVPIRARVQLCGVRRCSKIWRYSFMEVSFNGKKTWRSCNVKTYGPTTI